MDQSFYPLIVLSIIGSLSVQQDLESFCSSDPTLISVFNLGKHIIFQNNNREIFKLNQTDIRFPDQKTIRLTEKIVSPDRKMSKFLEQYFDLDSPITGFNVNDGEEFCLNSTDFMDCLGIMADSRISYTCFYGYDQTSGNHTIHTFLYKYDELVTIGTETIRKRMSDMCFHYSEQIKQIKNNPNQTIIGGIQYSYYNYSMNYTRIDRQLIISHSFNESDPGSVLNKQVNLYISSDSDIPGGNYFHKDLPMDQLVYVFQFNDELGIFGCPHPCELWSNLTRLHMNEKDGIGPRIEPTTLTLKVLLRCPQMKSWKPNEFCSQKGFLSVFNLGLDIIFQNPGKIWRYMSNGANNFGNPYHNINIQSIRFDSDLLQTLDQHFDITKKIFGFTYKNNREDLCTNSKDWKDCQQTLDQDPDIPYYHTCMYGTKAFYTNGTNIVEYKHHYDAFYYTPQGLRLFKDKRIYQETRFFCLKVFRKFLNLNLTIAGIFGESITRPDGQNTLYVFAQQRPIGVSGGQLQIYRSYFSRDLEPFDSLNNFTKLIRLSDNITEDEYLKTAIYYHGVVMAFKYDPEVYYSMDEVVRKLDLRSYSFKPLKSTIYDVYNCPFSQSYSIAYLEEEQVCSDFGSNPISVFQVDKIIYYQKGRRFYRWINKKTLNRLVFDKYFTDFMADHFDTRQRVVGYSYPWDDQTSRVVLFGTAKHNYKSIGWQLFRTFSLPRKSELHPLTAINSPKHMYNSNMTFGINNRDLKYSYINALGYYPNYYNLDETFIDSEKDSQSTGSNRTDVMEQMGQLFILMRDVKLWHTNYKERFEYPFAKGIEKNWTDKVWSRDWKLVVTYNVTRNLVYSKAFGMFEWNGQLFLTAWPLVETKSSAPIVVVIYDFSDSIANRSLQFHEKYTFLKDPNKIWKFVDFFNCSSESEFGSEAYSDIDIDFLYYLFLLLLIFLTMGLIVTIIVWDRNELDKERMRVAQIEAYARVSAQSKVVPIQSAKPIADVKPDTNSNKNTEQKILYSEKTDSNPILSTI